MIIEAKDLKIEDEIITYGCGKLRYLKIISEPKLKIKTKWDKVVDPISNNTKWEKVNYNGVGLIKCLYYQKTEKCIHYGKETELKTNIFNDNVEEFNTTGYIDLSYKSIWLVKRKN